MRCARPLAGALAAAPLLLLAACAVAPPAAAPAGGAATPAPAATAAAPFTTLAARFTDRALKQERAGELRQALDSWKVVAALRTQAAEPRRRVAELAARLQEEAARHYRDALARLQEGNVDAARRELLLTLAADPDHAAALEALKNRLDPEAVAHTVVAGETFESIAKKQYGDPAKGPLVARVNDLDPAVKPAPGTVLSLPGLAPPTAKPAPRRGPQPAADTAEAPESVYDSEPAALSPEEPPAGAPAAPVVAPVVAPPAPTAPPPAAPPVAPKPADAAEEQLAKAAELLQARKFEEAAAAAEKLAGHPVVGKRARELAAAAWFAVGEAAAKDERFAEALAAYRKAQPGREDAAAAIAAVERRKKEKAEEQYNAGVRFFINQQLDAAIRSWEQTLALNPEHPKAPKDIEKARGLQQKLKELR
jgi:tetratricopeptide (TPR) repeat protein